MGQIDSPKVNRSLFTLILATVVIVSAGSAIGQASGSGHFDDVPAEHWAEASIAWALANGVTVGVEEGRFDPEGLATRAQMATFLYRTVNLLQGNRITAHSAKGTIAFASKRHGNPEIFIMNAVGGNVRQLTQNDFPTWNPSWSPDGTMIAYTGYENHGQGEIYIMDVKGTIPRRLTYNNVDGHHDGHPSWSPDGTGIAFVSSRDGDSEIYTMNIDGTNLRQLTDNHHRDGSPAWSPDGTLIAFDSDWAGDFRPSDWDGPDVFLMNADGTRQRQLTQEYSSHHAPSGSPGGVALAAAKRKSEDAGSYNPSWSPDSARIAFTTHLDSGTEIFLMDADGTSQRQLTHNDRHFGFRRLSSSWSPDGTQILFAGGADLFITNVDGTGQRQITHSGHDYRISSSAWSSHTPGAGSEFYDDVPAGHWAEEEIGWVTTSGVNPKVGEDRFGPDGIVTRAQIAVFLHRAVQFLLASAVCGSDTDWLRCSETARRLNNTPQIWRPNNTPQNSGSDLFSDVSRADPANEAIGWAANNSVIAGVTKDRFDPGAPVTRAEMVAFLHRTAIVVQQARTPSH